MKVILQKSVDKLGHPGEIVEVADGYARNYLRTGGALRSENAGMSSER